MTGLAAHFLEPVCRNCGAALSTPFCAQCGQARARRFDLRAVGSEAWQGWRAFEWETVRAALRLIRRPGEVAREYVLGARRKHVHPLKLLLVAIGLLLVVQAHSGYFAAARDARVGRALALALEYGRWSFSLGLLAVFASSMLVLRRRAGFNATEHLVLAVYVQFLVLLAGIANLLPTLGAAVPAWHRAGSAWWMGAVEGAIVAFSFGQFFALGRRELLRLAGALALFLFLKWLLVWAYSRALVAVVLSQTSGAPP